MFFYFKTAILISACAAGIMVAAPRVNAQTAVVVPEVEKGPPPSGGVLWENIDNCRIYGDCEVNDFVQLGINISNFILGIVGSLALLMFVYGGLMWIISAGSSERVETGKSAIKNAVIGLILVFGSWLIINVVVRTFVCGGDVQCPGTVFDRQWYTTPS